MKKPSDTSDTESEKIKSSLNKFHGEAATSAIENASEAYQTPSLIAAGAGAYGISMMSFFTNLALAVLFVKAPGVVARLGSTKRAVVILALTSALTWLPLVFIFAFGISINPAMVIGLWVFNLAPSALLIPLRDNWLAGQVPARNVGGYFGLRSVVAGVAYLGTFSLMGYILDKFIGEVFRGYAVIMAVAFAACFGSFWLYRKTTAPREDGKGKESFGFLDFLKEMRGGGLGVFILFVSLFSLSVNLSSPLFAVYLLKNLNFTYLTYTLLISVEYLARIVSVTFWGKYADRVGSLRVLGVVSRFIPFIPILWLLSSNLTYLLVIQVFSGVVWAGFDLCSQTFIYKASPENKRLKYIGYYKSLVTLALALGALSGAYLIDVIPPVFGSAILGLFLLSGIARLAVVRLMFHKLVDLAWTGPADKKKGLHYPATNRDAVTHGLFYRPEEWTLYLHESVKDKAEVNAPLAKKGLFHRLADYLYETLYLHEFPAPDAEKVLPARGLFHQPETWSDYRQETVPVKTEAMAVPAKRGLFHKPAAWADYRQEIVPASAEGMAMSSRRGIFHQPEAWSDYRQETVPVKTEVVAAMPSRRALFHKLEQWADYRRQTSVIVSAESRVVPSRNALFRKPELWADYLKENSPAKVEKAVGAGRRVAVPVR